MALPTILSESRKYALSLFSARKRSLNCQMIQELLSSATVPPLHRSESAVMMPQALVREFAAGIPELAADQGQVIVPAQHLQRLPDYTFYIRTLLNGSPVEPYAVRSYAPFEKTGTEAMAGQVIRTSAERFGRDRIAVEKKLNRF